MREMFQISFISGPAPPAKSVFRLKQVEIRDLVRCNDLFSGLRGACAFILAEAASRRTIPICKSRYHL